MSRRHAAIAARVALVPALAYGWLAAASAIYCFGVGKWPLFLFPFDQWLIAAPYWRLNGWMTLWVTAGAAVPTAYLVVCGIGLVLHWWRNRGQPLYGTTHWATEAEARRAGFGLRRRFP